MGISSRVIHDLSGKRVTVMGLGRFGGGVSVARWLASQGADVLVTDLDTEDKLADSVGKLRDLIDRGTVQLRLGEHNVSDFTSTDLVVANPAVPHPWDNRFLRAAAAANVPVTTEIGLTIERLPDRARVVAITGSAGKSTTSALIHHALQASGRDVVFGGNIGGSLLPLIGTTITARTFVVLELSSFMLHWLAGWSPHVGVVTNFAPNHLDWHGDEAHYLASKRQILASQHPGDIAVLGPYVREWPTVTGVARIEIGPAAGVERLSLPGKHNALNASVAIAAATAIDPSLSHAAAESAIRTFAGLKHRLQLVAEIGGVKYFNDSKSTTPESTLLALEAMRESSPIRALAHVHLIAGGYDKGSDLTPIARLVEELAGLYTIGQTGNTIADASRGRAIRAGTLNAAVDACRPRVRPGDCVLLSPACASWGQYTNYEQRGDEFVRLVKGMQ
jgi:UDP-N-acetylmuramoylalanine--D-glutamate ligase